MSNQKSLLQNSALATNVILSLAKNLAFSEGSVQKDMNIQRLLTATSYEAPGWLSPRPGGGLEAGEQDRAGNDCLAAGIPDNCIDSRRRRWHISCGIRGRGHRGTADEPGSAAGPGEPWRSADAVEPGKEEEPENPEPVAAEKSAGAVLFKPRKDILKISRL